MMVVEIPGLIEKQENISTKGPQNCRFLATLGMTKRRAWLEGEGSYQKKEQSLEKRKALL